MAVYDQPDEKGSEGDPAGYRNTSEESEADL